MYYESLNNELKSNLTLGNYVQRLHQIKLNQKESRKLTERVLQSQKEIENNQQRIQQQHKSHIDSTLKNKITTMVDK